MEITTFELLIFLPIILVIGIITSYEDIKIGKIRNKWVLTGIIAGVVLNIGLISYYAFSEGIGINWEYIIQLSSNFFITAVFSIVLWLNHLWSAGDAKLFITYSLIVPLSVFSNDYIPYFPSMVIFINTIIPFFVYLLVRNLNIFLKKDSLLSLGKKVLEDLPRKFASAIFLSWVLLWLNERFFHMGLLNFSLFMILFMMGSNAGISFIFEKYGWKKRYLYGLYLLMIVPRFVFSSSSSYIFSLNFLISIVLSYSIIGAFAQEIGSKCYTKIVSVKDLKTGDVLCEGIFLENKEYVKKDISFKSALSSAEGIIDYSPEGLSSEEVKKIKHIYKKEKLSFEGIKVLHTMPFAQLMFLGVIISIIAKGTFMALFYLGN